MTSTRASQLFQMRPKLCICKGPTPRKSEHCFLYVTLSTLPQLSVANATQTLQMLNSHSFQNRQILHKSEVSLPQPSIANGNNPLAKQSLHMRTGPCKYVTCSSATPTIEMLCQINPQHIRNHPNPSDSNPHIHTNILMSYKFARQLKSLKQD